VSVAPGDRAFVAERRAVCVHRFDTLHSPHYDEHWGAVSPSHADPRQVPGEVTEGGGYHYYPRTDLVRGWLDAAGFALADEADADQYWHLLLQVRSKGSEKRNIPRTEGR
jgi:hypothetical protein